MQAQFSLEILLGRLALVVEMQVGPDIFPFHPFQLPISFAVSLNETIHGASVGNLDIFSKVL